MSKFHIIDITVSGETQCGKSAVLASIRSLLEKHGYCVAIPDCAERNNPSQPLSRAEVHELPNADRTVFVLREDNFSRRS